ncbi:MAG: phosphopantothenate--cysteine ligase [Clostridiales bacterium]|jgi:phosphopantothenate-cysteine ligase|nr:phosphopantothenate--cysteine ligase [Clostridiales bacterium]
MKILITSGGTAEKIDTVRSIVNSSTGLLGCAIAEAFAAQTPNAQIFYICGKNAARPKADVCITEIEDSQSAQNAISRLLADGPVDIIVHAMAVSDYSVKAVSTPCGMFKDIAGKISSDHDEIAVHLQKSPKIIGTLRGQSPKSTIVGFKLQSNVPRGTLLDAAYSLLQKNDCDFVLANDISEIAGDMHKGYLIDKYRKYSEHGTKAEIAQAIVQAALNHRRDI